MPCPYNIPFQKVRPVSAPVELVDVSDILLPHKNE